MIWTNEAWDLNKFDYMNSFYLSCPLFPKITFTYELLVMQRNMFRLKKYIGPARNANFPWRVCPFVPLFLSRSTLSAHSFTINLLRDFLVFYCELRVAINALYYQILQKFYLSILGKRFKMTQNWVFSWFFERLWHWFFLGMARMKFLCFTIVLCKLDDWKKY